MATSLIERLEELGPLDFGWNPPGDPAVLDRLEARLGARFPEDYREVMASRNGFALSGHGTSIEMEPLEELEGHNLDERFVERIPGSFVIGSDEGGSIYFYDPEGKLGKGRWALFLVPLSELRFEYAIHVGATLSEAVEAILHGEDFYHRPRLAPRRGPEP